MKFQSKKALRNRIAELEEELQKARRIERINTIIKEADLPKCEGRFCRSCAYAAKETTPWGETILQGCRKDIDCRSFIPETKIVISSDLRRW